MSLSTLRVTNNANTSGEKIERIVGEFQARMTFVNKTLYEQTGPQVVDPVPSQAQPSASGQTAADQVSGLRILWVDDHPTNNEGPASALESLGARITYAASTEEGLDQIDKAPQGFDLVLSDMGRGTDYKAGVELVEAIRAEGNKIPVVIYCSRRGIQQFGQAAIKAGAFDVVNGPSRLFAAIKAVLADQPRYANLKIP